MINQIIQYIRGNANSWPINFKPEEPFAPLLRFNKEANGIVKKEEIGTIILWFNESKKEPCLVTKIMDSSLSKERIKNCIEQHEKVNKKSGVLIFPIVYDVAEICGSPVIFQEAVNSPTYEMELNRAIYGPGGNHSFLKQTISRHFKEMGSLFSNLREIDVSNEFSQWGNSAYCIGKEFRDGYGLDLEILSEDSLRRMSRNIDSLIFRRHYALGDHNSANFFAGPRIVDQFCKSATMLTSKEPGIMDVFRFIIAYFRASPLNVIYNDWVGAIAYSIADSKGITMAGFSVRELLKGAGLNVNELSKIWALVMVGFFLRALDELAFHGQNIFLVSRLKAGFKQSARRLIEIQDLIDSGWDFDFSPILAMESCFNIPSAPVYADNLGNYTFLIEDGYMGFNIILFRNKVYALSQDLGAVDFANIEEIDFEKYKKDNKVFVGNTYQEVKEKIDSFIADKNPPKLIKENFKGFNIVFYKECYYAVSRDLGQLDVRSVDKGKIEEYFAKGKCFAGNSLKDIISLVEHLSCESLKNEISSRDSLITVLKSEVSIKEEDIKKLKNKVFQSEKNILKLNADFQKCKNEIKELIAGTENYQANIKEKDKVIDIFNSEISRKDEGINKFKGDIQKYVKKINLFRKLFLKKKKHLKC